MKDYATIALSSGDHKMACLFWDFIVPFHSFDNVPEVVRLPFHLPDDNFVKLVKENYSPNQFDRFQNEWVHSTYKYLLEKGIKTVPLFSFSDSYNRYFDSGSSQAIEIHVTRLPIIDTSLLEWDQLLEIKTDSRSLAKLRRLRTFLFERYKNKDDQYVQDSILKTLNDYHETCRRHGITTTLSTLQLLLDSKSLIGALGISLLGVLSGNPAATAISLAGGSIIEIGKMSIHIAEKKLEFESFKSNHELAYLIDIQTATTDKVVADR